MCCILLSRHRLQTAAGLCVLSLVAISGGLDAEGRKAARPVSVEAAPLPFDPAGRWVLTLPAGWQRKVVITRASEDTYLFDAAPKVLFNGVYELDLAADRLALIEANNPTQIAYEWRVLNANTLQLVRQDSPSGGSYVGATLSRHFAWDVLVDNSPVERVGSLSHRRAN